MLPRFLIPSGVIRDNGSSEPLPLPSSKDLLLLTLGIEQVKEQQSLLLGIYGSADGATWNPSPLVEFPEKFYCGASAVVLDPAAHPGVAFIRAQWKVARWGRGDKTVFFQLYFFAEALALQPVATRD